MVKVDAIVVGGGPAGLIAAYAMAKEELEVIVVERGEYSGSKNMGGLLYGTVLNRLIPGFHKIAPIERPVSRRSLNYCGNGRHLSLAFGSDEWSYPPFNNSFIVHRSQFDKWLAGEVEEVGGSLLEGMVVDNLIFEGEGNDRKSVGVKIRGDEEEFRSDIVVLAEGANSLLTKNAVLELGLKEGRVKQEYGVGVKEIISLPRKTIEDRFGLAENEGMALDFFGLPFDGVIGGGFVYTAKESLHVGIVAKEESLAKAGLNPNDILDRFKKHARVAPYLRDGELLEYSAHLVPEGGFDAIGELTGNGLMIVGDAAGLVNMSLYKEGTNLAMESGWCAAQAALAAKKKGDFSKSSLAGYERRLKESHVLKDLKKYRKVATTFESCPNLFGLYPEKMARLLTDYFCVGDEPKELIQKRARKTFLKGLPKLRFISDLIRAKGLC